MTAAATAQRSLKWVFGFSVVVLVVVPEAALVVGRGVALVVEPEEGRGAAPAGYLWLR